MATSPAPGPSVFIIDRLGSSGTFRVVPPVAIVSRGDDLTFRNFTQFDALVHFPAGLTDPQDLTLKGGNPSARPSVKVVAEPGAYEYEVLVTIDGRISLAAQGLSGPMMIVD